MSSSHRSGAGCHYDLCTERNYLGRHFTKAFARTVGKTRQHTNVLILHISERCQSSLELNYDLRVSSEAASAEKSDHWRFLPGSLLSVGRGWPTHGHSGEKGNELPPLHSLASSQTIASLSSSQGMLHRKRSGVTMSQLGQNRPLWSDFSGRLARQVIASFPTRLPPQTACSG